MSLFKKIMLGSALAASALTAVAPASAQFRGGYRGGYGGYHGGYGGYGYRGYHGYNGAGTAAVAGIAGLAIGAAIASNSNRGYYHDYYYAPRGYYYSYPAYEETYAYPVCHWERRFDPYYGPTRVRVCY